MEFSGGTTVGAIRASMAAALADDEITAVVAEFDSPGGTVAGIEELATWIRGARGQKPMVAVVNTMCCSAAYYLASQFDEIVGSPSSITGDIGVFFEHVEFSRQDEAEGVTTTIVRMPPAKHEVNSAEPLPESGLAHLQEIVGDYYGLFVEAVAAGRATTAEAVRSGYGQGRSLTAKRALAASLIDRVDTLEGTIARLEVDAIRAAIGDPATGARADNDQQPLAAAGEESQQPGSGHGAPELAGQPSSTARRRDLEVYEAALSRGYSLPNVGGTVS
jgi:signal peptide peptidase SppA